MAFPRIGGAGVPLSLTGAFGSFLSPLPVFTALGSLVQGTPFTPGPTNLISLPAGMGQILPAGTWLLGLGPVTALQFLDPVTQIWRTVDAGASLMTRIIDSDGANVRLANLTGTPVGALITNAGTGYTNGIGSAATGLTVTPSAGASVWQPVVGGAVNSTVTITAGGTNYTFPPLIVIQAPPAGGIQATATCTISGGAINAVTVVNQGAGYVTPPNILVVNDSRDTTGAGAVLTAGANVGSGTLTALYPTNMGTPLTAVPTFTFAPASTTAATAAMNFVVTGITVTGGGTGVPAGSFVLINSGAIVGTRAANTAGPITDFNLTQERLGIVQLNIVSGVIQTTGNIVVDPGYGFQAVPAAGFVSATGTATTFPAFTTQVGGITDTSFVQPI